MAAHGISRESALHMRRYCASANLRRAARVVTRHYNRALRAYGITAIQLPVLAAISAGGHRSISSLAADLDLERSTIVLKRRALIEMEAGKDRRAAVPILTPRGRKTLAAAFRAWQRAHDAITGAYGDEAYDALLSQTRQLGIAMKSIARRR